METNMKKNAVGNHKFQFNNDGSIDADYEIVDEKNSGTNMKSTGNNSPNNFNDDDKDKKEKKKKEEFVKVKDQDYFQAA